MLPYSSLLPLLITRYMEQVSSRSQKRRLYMLSEYRRRMRSTHYLNTNIYIANGVTGTQKERN